MTRVSSAREATKDLMSKQETPNAATPGPAPASFLPPGFIGPPIRCLEPSIRAAARRWEGDGEANGAQQQENVQSAGSCLPAHVLRVLWGAGGVGGSLRPGLVSHWGRPNGEGNQPASWKNAQMGNAGRIGEELKTASEEEGRRRVPLCVPVCESN